MFGFILGTVSLIALTRVVFRARHGYRHHGGGHWRGRHGWRQGGDWRRFALYSLFERLDATPGQEKVIAGAFDEMRGKLRKMREEWSTSRGQMADAMRGETLDAEQAQQVFSPYASHFDELRATAAEAMQKIHDALDDRQRRALADLIENGWGFGGHGACRARCA